MRSRMLKCLIAVSLTWSSTLFAQTPPASQQPPPATTQQPAADQQQPVTEEITVTGVAESLREAVKVKKEADAIVDAVAAKDVNKLPDKNHAEEVARGAGAGE